MLAIALVADAVLCAVFALMVRVGGPPTIRADVEKRQALLERRCQNEGMLRARAYEVYLDGQQRSIMAREEGIAGRVTSEWQLARGGWYAAGLDDRDASEMKDTLAHLTWCENLRDEIARELAGNAQP